MEADRTPIAGPIVVATDGSEPSRRAMYWSLEEAASRGSAVLLVHAAPGGIGDGGPQDLAGASLDPQALTRAKELVEQELTEAARFDPDVEVSARLLEGPTVPELVAAGRGAALLVLGSRGLGGSAAALGSVSQHVAAHAPCTVVLVRSRAGSAVEPGRVVVGVDGSAAAAAAARMAAAEAALRGSRLQLLHAEQAPAGDGTAEDFRQRLERLADDVNETWPDLAVELTLLDAHPVAALLEASRHADLVVVGSHGIGAFPDMLIGSVGQEVARRAESPVMVVRDQ